MSFWLYVRALFATWRIRYAVWRGGEVTIDADVADVILAEAADLGLRDSWVELLQRARNNDGCC